MLYEAERAAGYEHALDTRDVIGQAKGILMERFKLDEEQAFEMLITSSQETNLKLVEIARWLTRQVSPCRPTLESPLESKPNDDDEVGNPTLRIV